MNTLSHVDPAVYSSERACFSVAKRVVRDFTANWEQGLDEMFRILKPIGDEIVYRGKVRRNRMKPLVQSAARRINDLKTTVCFTHTYGGGGLSSNEGARLHLIFARGEGDRHIELSLLDVSVNRACLRFYLVDLEFSVTNHVLARYMMRERKPPVTFFEELARPLRASAVLAGAARSSDNVPSIYGGQHLALPFANGLLLGKAVPIGDQGYAPFGFQVTRDGGENLICHNAPERHSDAARCEIRTYISRNDTNDNREALLDDVLGFEDRAHWGLRARFGDRVTMFPGYRDPELMKDFEEDKSHALTEARKLVTAPSWRTYCQSVREGLASDVLPRIESASALV